MFKNTIDPVLLELGPFEIRYYGIVYALGFVLVYLFLKHFISKGKLKNMSVKKLDDLILYILLGTVIGARFFNFVFYHPSVFWTNPLEVLKIWNGGLSFHGGLIGVVFATWLFSKKHKVKFISLFDAIAIPASLGLAFGRLANFTNHELYGPITSVPWCVEFLSAAGCRHPYQIYASLSHFIMFGLVLYIYGKQKKEGTAFWSFIFTYGFFRFVTDFWRVEWRYLGISVGQYLSLIMVIIAGIILIKRWKSTKA